MSQAVTADSLPEQVVRNRSRYADTLHRQDPDADEPQPACPLQETAKEFTTVKTAAYRSHYGLCGNPECFGGDWR